MAQRVQIELVDDLNGQVAQETVRFALDGTKYEIDLTAGNATQLRSTLAEYVGRGRKASNSQNHSQVGPTATRKREELQQIRAWAQRNGHNPRPRGRVPQSILDAYTKAHK